MTSQIGTSIEYLIPTDDSLVPTLHLHPKFNLKNLGLLCIGGFSMRFNDSSEVTFYWATPYTGLCMSIAFKGPIRTHPISSIPHVCEYKIVVQHSSETDCFIQGGPKK